MNKMKTEQLGMSFSKACAILRKSILFDLIFKLGLNTCYKCHTEIKNVKDLSIEHKIPWQYSENPKELFFDLNNIAFSHLSCNSGTSRSALFKSLETKRKISLSLKGKKPSFKTIIKMREFSIKNNSKKHFGIWGSSGIIHPKSILDSEKVNKIREKRKNGVKLKDLAKEFNVSLSTIDRVTRNKRY
jgi:hypothetical protein